MLEEPTYCDLKNGHEQRQYTQRSEEVSDIEDEWETITDEGFYLVELKRAFY